MPENENLFARFAAGFEAEATALEIPDGPTFSYGDLDRASARAANVLRGLGLEPGDRVSVIAEKSPALLWLYLGCLRAGLVYHPLNPTYTESEIAFFLGDAGSRLVVCDPGLSTRVTGAAAACPAVVHVRGLDAAGGGDLVDAWRDADDTFATVHASGDDTAALLYSSGTTGTPKGIPLSHANLSANAASLAAAWGFTRDDVLLHALPMYHVHGLFITLGPALLTGLRLCFLPRFEVDAVVDALPRATVMAGVPTYYTRLLGTPRFTRETAANVRVFISGSAPLREETFTAFRDRTGHDILERYGMTETGINTSNPLTGRRVAGSVGPALPGVDVRVTGAGGATLGPGEIGDIEVRGANVFRGYWQRAESSDEAFTADGWFRTGDQGHLDDASYLFIVGRSKDMVITGGMNVYPKEVEQLLDGLPEVAESAVFGIAHDDLGEAVVAAIVTPGGGAFDERGLRDTLRSALAGYKVPKRIVAVDELPRNTMGKVQKNVLRTRFAELFGAGAKAAPRT